MSTNISNSMTSFTHTLIEFTLLAGNDLSVFSRGPRICQVYEEGGRGALYDTLLELTTSFETMYEGFEWDGEFFDAVDQYWNEWANELPHTPIRENFKLN